MTEEIQSVMQGKTALPLNNRKCLVFTGADRARYLNGQTTNDVTKLQSGQALHATVCTNKGKMQGEITIAHHGDSLLVDFPVALEETLPLRLKKCVIADDVEIQEALPALKGYHFITESAPDLPEDAVVFQSSRLQQPGYDVWLPAASTPEFSVASADTYEWVRIQSGIPAWGVDIFEEHLPPEAFPEDQTISYRKGCYIGQETIARVKSIGRVKKQLSLLKGSEALDSLPLDLVEADKKVGQLTSCQETADQAGNFHALAMIQVSHSDKQSSVQVGDSSWEIIRTCN